jgi:ATP-dependent DNA helicase RecG
VILVEEFIQKAERLLKETAENPRAAVTLYRSLKAELELIDALEWEKAGSEGEKLRLFVSHYEKYESLNTERQEKRLSNGFEMIEKLKRHFLLPNGVLSTVSSLAEGKKPEDLNKPVQYVKGVGPRWLDFFHSFDVATMKDLLFFFPRTYHDRRRITRISELYPNTKVTVYGSIDTVREKRTNYGLPMQLATLHDATGEATLIWYNQPYLKEQLEKAENLLVSGNVRWGRRSGWEIEVQDYEEDKGDPESTRAIVPVYRSRKGFPSKSIRKMIVHASSYISFINDPVPDWLNDKRALLPLPDAVYGLHKPVSQYHLNRCRKKMVYNEFFYFQVAVLFARRHREAFYTRPPREFEGKYSKALVKSLTFRLTAAQKKVYGNICTKLRSQLPVNVLLQGDVGCGKTIIAEMVLLDVVESGYQTAFMAPTSILAQQHYQKIKEHFDPLGIQTRLLISNIQNKEKEKIKEEIRAGDIQLVIGTHALIQEDVEFKNLGFALVDEQHRFGVKQRESLKNKGEQVDTLIMSATPIPRTLALAVYGDLDVETIDEIPPDRKPVRTVYVHDSKRDEVYDFIRREVEIGNQAYIVFPVIDESESDTGPASELKAATKMFDMLKKGAFKEYPLGLLHGRLKEEEKDAVMGQFVNGDIKILVATTVIEVGIDVPQATVIAIENPERFGLAQLHQLRGRVGRSERKSHCFLITQDTSDSSEKRLKYFSGCSDGFMLAEYDLQTRGPGDFLGVRQHGIPQFEFGDMVEDANLLFMCREDAQELLSKDNALENHPALREFLTQEYAEQLNRYQIG